MVRAEFFLISVAVVVLEVLSLSYVVILISRKWKRKLTLRVEYVIFPSACFFDSVCGFILL